MPRITKVWPLPADPPKYPEAKVLVYIDNQKCIPIRQRTWQGMGLGVGTEISCEELRERESFHWKLSYGAPAWEQEKIRLEIIRQKLADLDDRIISRVIGFGAGTTEHIAEHPEEPGSPDIEVCLQENGRRVMLVEVSGTSKMRGSTYWIRPDKLAYARNHPDQDVWVILHYALPEKFIFIRPLSEHVDAVSEKTIRGSVERYVEFSDHSPGVVSEQAFHDHLKKRVTHVSRDSRDIQY